MLLTYFGNDRDIFDDAFYNSAEGGFDIALLSTSSTQVTVRNEETGYTTRLTGTGLAASDDPADLAGTLTGLEISSPTGVIASFTGLNWDLPALYTALEQLFDSDDDAALMALLSSAPLTVDASSSNTNSTFLLDQVTAPVTYLGSKLLDEITTGSGDDRLFGDGFAGSYAEEASGQVYRLYQATLDRAPDLTGHHNWTERLLTGTMSLQEVINGFTGSPEFKATYGNLDNQSFVTLLYNNVLDRAPDATGLTNWTARLDGGMSRAEVVKGFSESAEFKAGTAGAAFAYTYAFAEDSSAATWGDDVYRLYQATLDRAPDINGFLNWSGRLADGMELGKVIDGFVQSAEFKATYGALDNGDFVTLLYNNVLGRDPDATGLTNWTARLDGGMSRAQVVEGFSQSTEFKAATADALKEWLRDVDYGSGSIYHDLLHPGAGDNLLAGGIGADAFEFAQAEGGSHRVLDLEPWDYISLEGFGYADAAAALSHMTQAGSDVSFEDQGVSITFSQTLLAEITDDMILI
ncbi:hypothetical protein CEW88_23690 (plasmid) [Alloyangia pacifica]|uniref:DUF4214 domain-containing protein n=1 Tax=Alloyangia pacifica TaxID=311180 RepID=A0A2U8HLV0_9RHOB|nr:DUF4214 domain-containing protein [Alloyangia pacifica]AWI86768.1 hypothetical protein CEW88_23690 [Alloyangia pacifica]